MKNVLLLVTLGITILASTPKNVFARSGCCSHHGGICGCGCCDGSALSNTCAPYYPSCSHPVYYAPVTTMVPIIYTPRPSTSTIVPGVKSAIVGTIQPEKAVSGSVGDMSGLTFLVISGVGLVWLVLKILKKI